jgi:hypothetical protein
MAKVGILFLNRKPLPATPRLPQAMSLPFCDAIDGLICPSLSTSFALVLAYLLAT